MESLTFNSVLRIDSDELRGFYRVVATMLDGQGAWLAFSEPLDTEQIEGQAPVPVELIGQLHEVPMQTLAELSDSGQLLEVQVKAPPPLLKSLADLPDHERRCIEARAAAMKPFLNYELLHGALVGSGGIAPLVNMSLAIGTLGRASIYRLWPLLCRHGFEPSSLVPRFDRCGAPGVLRPMDGIRCKAGRKTLRERLGEPDPHPQQGVTERDRLKIWAQYQSLSKLKTSLPRLYAEIIRRVFVTRFEHTAEGLVPVMPVQGTYPNWRQFRHIVESSTTLVDRIRERTTTTHFLRTGRGLRGRSYDGVPGPGYCFAIDATIGDIYLRSSINGTWLIGRPIVYMVVDVWSSAIVGFYVCLSGPSWDMAKQALFSVTCEPALLSRLWGFNFDLGLAPLPTLPFTVLSDRGEYVSSGARETCQSLGLALSINPAYRPDLKGLVEVLHRIVKDQQFAFLPGAFDRRRQELELSANPKESVMTIRAYVNYLVSVVRLYNQTADRSDRLTAEMIAANVKPFPADLWSYGHSVGIGYRKAIDQDRLKIELLKHTTLMGTRRGVFHESLRYESDEDLHQVWAATARHAGVQRLPGLTFQASNALVWGQHADGRFHELKLCANARAPAMTTSDEWRDALAAQTTRGEKLRHDALAVTIGEMAKQHAIRSAAIKATKAALAEASAPAPTIREARMLEATGGADASGFDMPVDADVPPAQGDLPLSAYEAAMDDLFSKLNAEEAAQ